MKQEIIVVLDRSGSMASIQGDMEGGLRGFVAEQKKLGEAGLTLVLFDDKYEVAFEGRPLSGVEPSSICLHPRGSTALLDAVGRTVVSQGERFAKMSEAEKPERVALMIVTDGHENASKDWTKERLRVLLKEQQERWKWAVTFLGCGIDAFDDGLPMGVNAGAILSTGRAPDAIKSGFLSASCSVGGYRSTGTLMDYDAQQRASAQKGGQQ